LYCFKPPKGVRAMTELTGPVEQLLREASEIANARGHAVVGTEHLLLAMTLQTDDSFARRLLDEAGVTQTLRSRIESVIGEG
jgi:ATP-dependent Clp protease ATP-binding subunit ClpA